MTTSRAKRVLVGTLVYAAIIVVTLLAVDGICIVFGLFPPSHNYGDPDLGWRPAPATGHMDIGRCVEASAGTTVTYDRNEDGIRTSRRRDQIMADSISVRIAVTGDSHTELCARNAEVHSGVLEAELIRRGIPAIALNYGAGKYSPLQDYLAFQKVLQPYRPRVLVMNLYTGNDFYDMLRADDRPHFVSADTGYRIADPVWFSYDDPKTYSRSRVLFAARAILDKVGARSLYHRAVELRRMGARQGSGLSEIWAYMRDLLKAREPSVGYSDAFTAQMLNQQLFFHHFPSGKDESIREVRTLMGTIRRDHPDLVLVMSPLPSYELTGEQPVDSALIHALKRLPISYGGGVREEKELYERLRGLAAEQGWLFVDNLAVLQAYHGPERLYNNFDYHLLPAASALIGRAQAAVLVDTLRRSTPPMVVRQP